MPVGTSGCTHVFPLSRRESSTRGWVVTHWAGSKNCERWAASVLDSRKINFTRRDWGLGAGGGDLQGSGQQQP